MYRNCYLQWRAVLVFAVLAMGGLHATHAGETVRVCTNQESTGTTTMRLAMHLMTQVRMQFPAIIFEYTALPWKRCLFKAEQGEFDAVLTASFLPERAKRLVYPHNADGSLNANKRMFNLGMAMIRRAGSSVTWDGEQFVNLDGPAGVQLGYSIGEYLRTHHVEVDDGSPTVVSGLRKLSVGRIGVFVFNPFNLDAEINDASYASRLELVTNPLVQKKPYFLIFSNQYNTAQPDMPPKIWGALELARNTGTFKTLYTQQMGPALKNLDLRP